MMYEGTPTTVSSWFSGYAQFFEWDDGNPKQEDRVGYFVNFSGEKITISGIDTYVAGVVSAAPAVLGNADDGWKGLYLSDPFDRLLTEDIPVKQKTLQNKEVPVLDADGNPIPKLREVTIETPVLSAAGVPIAKTITTVDIEDVPRTYRDGSPVSNYETVLETTEVPVLDAQGNQTGEMQNETSYVSREDLEAPSQMMQQVQDSTVAVTDAKGDPVYETTTTTTMEPVLDADGNPVYETQVKAVWVESPTQESQTIYRKNPAYDPEKPYVTRALRPEWDAVILRGPVSVRDDGTCEVNGYCCCTASGIATKADLYTPAHTWRVLARIDAHTIRIDFR